MKKIIVILIIVAAAAAGFYFLGNLKGDKNPVASKDDLIVVESPRIGDRISSPLIIRGEARGPWFFEATFPVTLTNWDGLIIAQHYAEAQLDPNDPDSTWMTTEFVPFETKLFFENPVFPGADKDHFSRRGYLILHKSNASGLPEHDDALEFEVFFK